jgi:hypothetical protein
VFSIVARGHSARAGPNLVRAVQVFCSVPRRTQQKNAYLKSTYLPKREENQSTPQASKLKVGGSSPPGVATSERFEFLPSE